MADFIPSTTPRTTSDSPERPPTIFPPSVLESTGPASADEDDYIEDLFDPDNPSPMVLEAARRVSWAKTDRASPCYAHLLVDGGDDLKVEADFEFGKPEWDLLLAANRYNPHGHYDIVAFGLRGAKLRGKEKYELVDRIPLKDARPDHVNFQCVLGFYFRSLGKFSAYTASTVPWHSYMSANRLRFNLLPTGCYIYKKGDHRPATRSRWVIPALRLSDKNGAESGEVTVLRTKSNAVFGFDDVWDQNKPSDNIHSAYSDRGFSSLGCQTVKGGMTSGLWADFQSTIRTLPTNARVDYVLLTGAECSIAASLLKAGSPSQDEIQKRLTRLRFGSEGEEVRRLQANLNLPQNGYFDAATKKKLTEAQTANGLPPDGIYAPVLDQLLNFRVFAADPPQAPAPPQDMVIASAMPPKTVALESTAAATAGLSSDTLLPAPTPPVAAPAPSDLPLPPAPEPSPVLTSPITMDLLRKIAPRPRDARKAAIWDVYAAAITSPQGAKVMADYQISANPQRVVFILANMLAETGGLTLFWENMAYRADRLLEIFGRAAKITPSEAQRLSGNGPAIGERVYGLGNPRKAKELGNTEPGDGFRYRGGGFLQTTGRWNYRTLGQRIGEDLEGKPELIENGIVSLKAACAEWHRGGLNDYADKGSFRACCNGINRGNPKSTRDPIGFDHRLKYLKAALSAFGLPPPKRAPGALESTQGGADGLQLGDVGDEVAALQRDLKALGYDAGPDDGLFTTQTRDALLAFQARNGLTPTGIADAETTAMLASEDAIAQDRVQGATPESVPVSGTRSGGGSFVWPTMIVFLAIAGLLAVVAASGLAGPAASAAIGGIADVETLLFWLTFGGWGLACLAGLLALGTRRSG